MAHRRWRVMNQIENMADSGEIYPGSLDPESETVWPYDYRRSYVPSQPQYGVYPTRMPGYAETQGPPRRYRYEEVVVVPEPPRVYQQLADDQIRDSIYDRLDSDYQVPADAEIQLMVDRGVVTITGQVRNRRFKQLIGQHAWQQPGVHDVHNNLVVARRWQF